MSGLISQGFLTAMKQEATRAHKDWALDKVAIHNDVLKLTREEITSSPSVCMTWKDVSVLILVFSLYYASLSYFGLIEEKVTIVFTLMFSLSVEAKY